MLPLQTECFFQIGVATPLTGDCGTPDSSMDTHPQLETTLRMSVKSCSRRIDVALHSDDGVSIHFARVQRSSDHSLLMTLNESRPPQVTEADLRRVVASIASVCKLTDGREVWHFEDGQTTTVPFAVHRKGGIKLLEHSTSECVAQMSLRGRRLTNRNKKQPASPEDPYVFEAKTPKNDARQDKWVRRDGGVVDAVAHPFIAILREIYQQAATGNVSLQDCVVPWKGGVGGQPNGNLECYDGNEPRRVYLPVLCFAIDEGN